jgi:hypothetical protein
MVEVWRRGRARQTARLTPPPTASRGGISATQVSPEGEVEGGDGRGGETEQDIARRRARRDRAGRAIGVRRARIGKVGSGGAHDGDGPQSRGVCPRAGQRNGEGGCPNQGEHQNEIDGHLSHPGASRTTKHARHPAVYALTQGRRRPRSLPIAIPMAMMQTTWAGMGRQCGCHPRHLIAETRGPFALVVMATGKVAAIRRPAIRRHGMRIAAPARSGRTLPRPDAAARRHPTRKEPRGSGLSSSAASLHWGR